MPESTVREAQIRGKNQKIGVLSKRYPDPLARRISLQALDGAS